MKPIYLDHAAATPMDVSVAAAMQPYFSDRFCNPSALYLAAQAVSSDLETARRRVAQLLGCRPAELIFTAGGTEANNMAILGVLKQYPEQKVVVSAIEHESVLEPAKQYDHALVPVDRMGIVDVTALERLIDDRTVLVSVMYANNEIGTVQPIRVIARKLAEIRRDRQQRNVSLPLMLHTDAAQAGNYLDLHVARLGVDMMTLNGGKVYGPKQSGSLYVRSNVTLQPSVFGGGQERGLRSGTENVAAIIGFAEALCISQDIRHEEAARLAGLRHYFIDRLGELRCPVMVNGSLTSRLPNNVHITVPGHDNERLVMALDEAGIMVAAGSACSASKDEASHVLLSLGLSETAARSSLRFTMGRGTTPQEIDRTLSVLTSLLA